MDRIFLPAFTLEPLVENALLYGLEPKEEGGVLRIKISQYRNRIRIRVLDTGLGMDDRILKDLGEYASHMPTRQTRESDRGIGLQNVQARLRIFFDAREEFRIYSKKGRGTLVWISFPVDGRVHV